MKDTKLESGIVWQDDGHLSEVAIVALADGQDILPAAAASHVEACEGCTRRLGEAALLSANLGGALLSSAREERRREPVTRPFPVYPILLGLGVAALGASPFVADASTWLPRAPALLAHALPVVTHTAVLALRSIVEGSQASVIVSFGSIVVSLAAGLGVLRLTPREGVVR
jgi:hypothetical protein